MVLVPPQGALSSWLSNSRVNSYTLKSLRVYFSPMSQLDSKLIFEQTRSRLGGLVQTRESGLSCANLVEKKIPRNGVVFAVTGLGIFFPSCLLMYFFFLPQNLTLSHSHESSHRRVGGQPCSVGRRNT